MQKFISILSGLLESLHLLWVLQLYRSPREGAVIMDPKITIHIDYCSNKEQANIQAILSAVTELIAAAVVRAAAESDGKEV